MRRAAAMLFLLPSAAWAQGISSTKHNLSVSGPGPVKSTDETQICVFCHVPHRGSGGAGSTADYTPYNSSTLVSPLPGQPSGATRTCLSCHDGTIAMGAMGALGTIGGSSRVGLDLRFSHPVSFVPAPSPELRAPPPGHAVRLDGDGRLQCTSCHDPHIDDDDPVEKKFLVADNRRSTVCTTCHVKAFWAESPSAHQTSTKVYDAARGAHAGYSTIADHGCQSCHRSHAAGTPSRLLDVPEPQLCLRCHDGQVAARDVSSEFARAYSHPVFLGAAGHDAAEGPASATHPLPETSAAQPRHATCADCHDPHSAGAATGLWGIDASGAKVEPVRYEYEICFRCHADSANQPQRLGPLPPSTVRRAVVDANLRRRLDPTAPSAHPVVGPGRSAGAITCTSCHQPHGSGEAHLLQGAYATADRTVESPAAYSLCYGCHDRGVLLSDLSRFKPHKKHVVDAQTPCSACHDAHGVSALQGNPINNAHLVDFDVSIVQPRTTGARGYESTGPGTGSCSLSCHGRDHDRLSY